MNRVWTFTPTEQRFIHYTALRRRRYHEQRGTPNTRASRKADPLRMETIGVAAELAARKLSEGTGGRFPITVNKPDIGIDGIWGGATWAVKGSDWLRPSLIMPDSGAHPGEMVADAGMAFGVGWEHGEEFPTSACFGGWITRSEWYRVAHRKANREGMWVPPAQLHRVEEIFDWLGLKVAPS